MKSWGGALAALRPAARVASPQTPDLSMEAIVGAVVAVLGTILLAAAIQAFSTQG